MTPKRLPLFQPSAPLVEPIQPPEDRPPLNPAEGMTASLMRGINIGRETRNEPDPVPQPDPTDNVDVELSDTPFTKKELAAGVSKDSIVRGLLQLAAYKVPEDVSKLNEFLNTSSSGNVCGNVELIGAPHVIDTQTGVFVLVWYRPCHYPRRKKASSS